MKAQELNPALSEDNHLRFDWSAVKFAPEQSGCYVLTSYDREILYIGKAENLSRRMKDHLNEGKKSAFWFYWRLEEKEVIDKLERAWLNHHCEITGELPPFNKIYA